MCCIFRWFIFYVVLFGQDTKHFPRYWKHWVRTCWQWSSFPQVPWIGWTCPVVSNQLPWSFNKSPIWNLVTTRAYELEFFSKSGKLKWDQGWISEYLLYSSLMFYIAARTQSDEWWVNIIHILSVVLPSYPFIWSDFGLRWSSVRPIDRDWLPF